MNDIFLMYMFFSYCKLHLTGIICNKDCKYYRNRCIDPEYPLKKFNMFCKEFGLKWN